MSNPLEGEGGYWEAIKTKDKGKREGIKRIIVKCLIISVHF